MKIENQKGNLYYVERVNHKESIFEQIQDVLIRRTIPREATLRLEELYNVKWTEKPFPFSYFKEVKPNQRFFFHTTTIQGVNDIL